MRIRIGAWFNRDRWPRALVGMIALVVAVEAFVTLVENQLLGPAHWDWRLAGQAAQGRKAAEAEVLCFGDSLVKYGVQPRVLGNRLRRRTYNLAIAGGQASSSYFLLQRALRAGARPSVLVVDFAPMTLRTSSCAEPRNWSELLSLGETIDLTWATRNFELLASIVVRQVIPSLRVRFELRARLLAISRRKAAPRRNPLSSFFRNLSVNDGALVMPPSPIGKQTAENCRRLFATWDCDPTNARYLERFLALAEAHRIPVLWLLTPTARELQAFSESTGFDTAYTGFVASAQRRHRNVLVVDARRSEYREELYHADPLHLNRRGASVLSDDLAAIIARRLARSDGSRWIALPKFQARSPGIEVEDLSQSELALTLPSAGPIRR